MFDAPLRIIGVPGSPYSRKLRAVLRYRRIPHAWINQGAPEAAALPRPRVQLLPQLVLRRRRRRARSAHRFDAAHPRARDGAIPAAR